MDVRVCGVGVCQCVGDGSCRYGVALVCRIDKIIGLFCKRAI